MIKPALIMKTALLAFALLSCFSLIDGKYEEETCNGTRREDSSYEFELPDPVFKNVQDPKCDAEWSTDDQRTAILDGNSARFSHPFKNVTLQGISIYYCPAFVRFHVTCPKYTKKLMCHCTNSTNPVLSTILPSGDTIKPWRKHYGAIAAASIFAIVLLILAFLVCRTNRTRKYAPDEHNQHGSAE